MLHLSRNRSLQKQVILHRGKNIFYRLFRFFLLIGLSYIILIPIISKVSASFMSKSDLYDTMVKYIPRSPTLENYSYVIEEASYFSALFNTTCLSLLYAVLQTISCAMIGYGLAKFKFKGRGIIFTIAIFTMIVPPDATINALYMNFRYFNPLGILGLFSEKVPNLIDTPLPLTILSATGFAFKNGLYILLMRQFFRGVPDEVLEAAEVDGALPFRTFISIVLPMSSALLVTVFMLSFAWQWTDCYYSSLLFQNFDILANVVSRVSNIGGAGFTDSRYTSVLINTASVLVITPLMILYLFAQKKLIQGIERTGLVG